MPSGMQGTPADSRHAPWPLRDGQTPKQRSNVGPAGPGVPVAVAISVTLGVLVLGALLVLFPGGRAVVLLDDTWQLGAATTAAVVSIQTARRLTGRPRLAWGLTACYASIWATGQTLWLGTHLVGVNPGGQFTALDAIFYSSAVPLILGLLVMARPRDLWATPMSRLDALMVTVTVALLIWVLTLEPVVNSTVAGVSGWVALGAVGQGLMLTVALLALARGRRRGEALLAGSVVLLGVGGALYTYLVSAGLYAAATPVALTWTVGFLGIAMAGRVTRREPLPKRARPAVVQMLVHVLPMVVVWGMFIVQRLGSGVVAWPAYIVGLVVFSLMVLRLALTLQLLQRREDDLAALASTDELTGLPNRRGLWETAAPLLARAKEPWVLALVDLPYLREVNDRLGVAGGDALLRAVATRLQGVVQPQSVVSRTSSDFAVLFQLPATGYEPTPDAFAHGLLALLRGLYTVDDLTITIDINVGYAVSSAYGAETVDDLYRHAGLAMAAAKRAGPDQARGYDDEMHNDVIARHDLSQRLRQALRDREFVLHYQPVVDLATRRIVGAEALLRWDRPDRGLLLPAAFIDVAEETGLIVGLGRWVVAEAAATVRSWESAALLDDDFRVAVNLSGRQFDEPGLVDMLVTEVARAGARPQRIALEITETQAVDMPIVQPLLAQLRDVGFEVSLDDFGIAYSSLAYLRHLSIDTIKLDRLFVSELGGEEDKAAIPRAIIDVARGLHLGLIAEGVEREEQARRLLALGCVRAQGFLFAPGLPADSLAEMLQRQAIDGPFEPRPRPRNGLAHDDPGQDQSVRDAALRPRAQ